MSSFVRGFSLVLLTAILAVAAIAGCGGGGGAAEEGAVQDRAAGARLVLVMQRTSGQPRLLGTSGEEVQLAVSSGTQTLNVLLQSGGQTVAARSVQFDPQASSQQVVLQELPVGTFQLLLEFLDSSGNAISFFSTEVTLVPGGVTRVVVTPNASPSPTQRLGFVYTADYESGTVSGFALNQNGTLTALPNSPYSAGGTGAGTEQLAVDPARRLLFASNNGSEISVRSFRIDSSTGALTAADTEALTGFPQGLDVHPNPTIPKVYAATGGGTQVQILTYDPLTGLLTAGTPLSDLDVPIDLSVHPAGNFAFASTASGVNTYSVDSGGGLALVSGVNLAGQVRRSRIGLKSGRSFLYSSARTSDRAVKHEMDTSTGALFAQQTEFLASLGGPASPLGLDVHPTMNHLYQACGSGHVVVFNLDANGVMNHSQTVAAPSSGDVTSVKVDAAGSFLLASHHVGSSLPGQVLVYSILPNGQLSFVTSATSGVAPDDVLFVSP